MPLSPFHRNLLLGVGACIVISAGVVVVLRQRNLAGLDAEGNTQIQRSRSSPVQDGDALTAEQQRARAEAAEREKTLPQDLRQTWTAEFAAEMAAREQDRPPIESSTSTQ